MYGDDDDEDGHDGDDYNEDIDGNVLHLMVSWSLLPSSASSSAPY